MPKFAEDYIQVNERIIAFRNQYPDGSLQSEIVELSEKRVVIRATAYRTPFDTRPGIGHSALDIPGATQFTRGSELENAETSAWGRALAALGFEVKRGIASQDEINVKLHDRSTMNARTGEITPATNEPPTQRMRAPTNAQVEEHRAEVMRVVNAGKAPPPEVSDADVARIVEAGKKVKATDPLRWAVFDEWVQRQGGWGKFRQTGGARVDEGLAILEGEKTTA